GSDVAIDLRVDDHPDPVTELARLLVLHDLYFGRADPTELLPLTGPLAAEVDAAVAALGHDSLDGWAGVENLEERLVAGAIDPLVLARLRASVSDTPEKGGVTPP
ncbi:MAG: fimbrial assembly protein FimA, partial [Pseudonocardia sp.]|nr:fimbrial assembly protein FimA [Pseudonocardia sp.]